MKINEDINSINDNNDQNRGPVDLLVEDGQNLKLIVKELKASSLIFEGSGKVKNKDGFFQVEKISAVDKQVYTASYKNIFQVTCDKQSLFVVGNIEEELNCVIYVLGNSE